MKEKQGVNAIVVLIMVLIFLVIGIIFGEYFYSENIFRLFTKSNTSEVKNNGSDLKNVETLKNKKYVLNLDDSEYISFVDDKNYEYKHYNNESKMTEVTKGTYEYSNSKIKFDGVTDAIIEDGKLILANNSNDEVNLFGDSIYYDLSIIVDEFSKISKVLSNYVKEYKTKDSSLAEVNNIKTDISHCGKKENGNIVCSIGYNVYFKESENYSLKACEATGNINKFSTYAVSSGFCEYNSVYNWSFFELKLDNGIYTISSTYTG